MSNQLLTLMVTQAWQIAVLAIVVAIVTRTIAKKRPHLAHAVWILVLIKCVTPPIWGHSLGVFSQLQARWASDEQLRTGHRGTRLFARSVRAQFVVRH